MEGFRWLVLPLLLQTLLLLLLLLLMLLFCAAGWAYCGPIVGLWWAYGGPMVSLWWPYLLLAPRCCLLG